MGEKHLAKWSCNPSYDIKWLLISMEFLFQTSWRNYWNGEASLWFLCSTTHFISHIFFLPSTLSGKIKLFFIYNQWLIFRSKLWIAFDILDWNNQLHSIIFLISFQLNLNVFFCACLASACLTFSIEFQLMNIKKIVMDRKLSKKIK